MLDTEFCKIIRPALKSLGFTGRCVRGDSSYSTAKLWSTGDSFTNADKAAMTSLGIMYGGNCAILPYESQAYYLRKIEEAMAVPA